jgi:hypothetical protein
MPKSLPPWLRRTLVIVLLLLSFVAIEPLSLRVAEHQFDHPYRPGWPSNVLLVWPDHLELQELKTTDGVMHLQAGAPYMFFIPPDRQKVIQEQLSQMPPAPCRGAWELHVTQRSSSLEEIQLDCVRDGMSGLRYQATSEMVHALSTRSTGNAGLVLLPIHVAIWGSSWLLMIASYWLFTRIRKRRHASIL